VIARSSVFRGVLGVISLMTLSFQNVRGWSPVEAGPAALPMT
jgi:hypothetical protein